MSAVVDTDALPPATYAAFSDGLVEGAVLVSVFVSLFFAVSLEEPVVASEELDEDSVFFFDPLEDE